MYRLKKNEAGEVVEVYCEYDPNTKSGMPEANRKVKGTLHWVSCNHCLEAEVRLYDRLWKVETPVTNWLPYAKLKTVMHWKQ